LNNIWQEIESGSEEAHIAAGGEARDNPSESQLHPIQQQQQLNEPLQSPPPLDTPPPQIQTPSSREPV